MQHYTVTLTAAQGGKNKHVFQVEADDVYDAVLIAYRRRYDHATPTRRDIHPRGSNIGEYHVVGSAGSITFADVEINPVQSRSDDASQCPACTDHPGWSSPDRARRVEPRDTCRTCFGSGTASVHYGKVWRCSGGSGSGLAMVSDHGFVEVFKRDLDSERQAGTTLFQIFA